MNLVRWQIKWSRAAVTMALSAYATSELRNLGIYLGQENESMSCACDEMNDEGRSCSSARMLSSFLTRAKKHLLKSRRLLCHLYNSVEYKESYEARCNLCCHTNKFPQRRSWIQKHVYYHQCFPQSRQSHQDPLSRKHEPISRRFNGSSTRGEGRSSTSQRSRYSPNLSNME